MVELYCEVTIGYHPTGDIAIIAAQLTSTQRDRDVSPGIRCRPTGRCHERAGGDDRGLGGEQVAKGLLVNLASSLPYCPGPPGAVKRP